jgi:hypothetical protein
LSMLTLKYILMVERMDLGYTLYLNNNSMDLRKELD